MGRVSGRYACLSPADTSPACTCLRTPWDRRTQPAASITASSPCSYAGLSKPPGACRPRSELLAGMHLGPGCLVQQAYPVCQCQCPSWPSCLCKLLVERHTLLAQSGSCGLQLHRGFAQRGGFAGLDTLLQLLLELLDGQLTLCGHRHHCAEGAQVQELSAWRREAASLRPLGGVLSSL